MTSTKIIARAAAFAATLMLAPIGALEAAEPTSRLAMKPLHGISFDVGSERATSFFLAENGACKLVLTLADEPSWNDAQSFISTRFEATIGAEKAISYHSNTGKTLEFVCEAGAAAMNVTQIDEIAASSLR